MQRTRILWLTLVLVALPTAAWAYVDPGSGSVMLQMAVAAIMGVAVTIKLQWHRIRTRFFGGSKPDDKPDLDD